MLDLGSNWFCRSIAAALSGDENRQFRDRFDRRPVEANRAIAACSTPLGTPPNSSSTGGRCHPLPDQERLPLAASPQELSAVEDGLPLLLALESGTYSQRIERAASSVDSRVGRKTLPTDGKRPEQPNGALRSTRRCRWLRSRQANQGTEAFSVGGYTGNEPWRRCGSSQRDGTRWCQGAVETPSGMVSLAAEDLGRQRLFWTGLRWLGSGVASQIGDRGHQAFGRPAGISRPSETLDSRAHLRLAGSKPETGAGLRTERIQRHRAHLRRHDTSHAPSTGLIPQHSSLFRQALIRIMLRRLAYGHFQKPLNLKPKYEGSSLFPVADGFGRLRGR